MSELAVAIAFFAIFAAGITAVVGAAVSSRVTVDTETGVVAAVADAAARIAAQPYGDLLADTFTVPDPCDPAAATGTAATSCVTVDGRTWPVTWTTTVTAGDATTAATITVTGTVTVDRGVTRTVTRTVPAPIDGYAAGQGVIRITAADPTAVAGQTVYVLTTRDTVAATATFTAAGIAVAAVDPADCPAAAPCAVALTDTGWGRPNPSGTVLIGPGARGSVVAVADQLTPTVVTAADTTAVRVLVAARNPSGAFATAPADTAGSVCVWATVTDDAGDRTFPVCNTGTADRIVIDSYPTGVTPTARMPIVAATTIRFTVDDPAGGCPTVPGQTAATPTGWTTGAVCTSWTWGTPNVQHTPAGTGTFGDPIPVGADGADVTVVWSGNDARPAAGYAGEALWAHPRTVDQLPGDCDETATCTSVAAPEPAECPDEHCNSTRTPAPNVTADGNAAVAVTGTTPVEFTVTTTGTGDPVTVAVTAAPTGGTIAVVDGETVTPLGVGDGITPGATVRYTPAAAITVDRVELTVSGTGGTRTVPIWFTTGTQPIAAHPLVTAGPTPAGAPLRIAAYTVDQTGAPTSATVTVTVTGSSTVPATLTGDATGWAAGTGTTAGTGTVTVTTGITGAAATSATTTITAVPAALTVTAAASVAHPATVPVTVTAVDGGGDPLAGVVVDVTATTGTTAVTVTPARCTTGAGGACAVSFTTPADGNVTVRGVAAGVAATTTVEVTR